MPWWDAPEGRQTHEVTIPCLCADPDFCVTERYVADVRIAVAEIERLAYAVSPPIAYSDGKPGA